MLLTWVLARPLRHTNTSLADLISTDGPGRVARQLLGLAQRFGTPEGGALRVIHDLTQDEIARLTGASRETVNKALVNGFTAGPFDSRLVAMVTGCATRRCEPRSTPGEPIRSRGHVGW